MVVDNSGWAAVKGATLRVYPNGQAKSKGSFQASLPADMDFSKIVEAAGGSSGLWILPKSRTRSADAWPRFVRATVHCCMPALRSSDCANCNGRKAQRKPKVRNLLKMACDASAECLDVRPHGALRSVGIMLVDGGKNGFMLLLKAAVVVRRGK